MPYYAVIRGRKPGVYSSYEDCKRVVHGFSNHYYRKFDSKLAAPLYFRYNREDEYREYDSQEEYLDFNSEYDSEYDSDFDSNYDSLDYEAEYDASEYDFLHKLHFLEEELSSLIYNFLRSWAQRTNSQSIRIS